MGNTPSSPPPGHGIVKAQPPAPDHYPLCDDEGVYDAKTCDEWCGGPDEIPTSYWDTLGSGKTCTCSNCSMRTCPDHTHECQRSAGHPPAPRLPPFPPGVTEFPWEASGVAGVRGAPPMDAGLFWLVSGMLVVGVVAYSLRKRHNSKYARLDTHERLPLWSQGGSGYGSLHDPQLHTSSMIASSA